MCGRDWYLEEVRVGPERVAERVHVALLARQRPRVVLVRHVERIVDHLVVHGQEERNVGEVVEEANLSQQSSAAHNSGMQ